MAKYLGGKLYGGEMSVVAKCMKSNEEMCLVAQRLGGKTSGWQSVRLADWRGGPMSDGEMMCGLLSFGRMSENPD